MATDKEIENLKRRNTFWRATQAVRNMEDYIGKEKAQEARKVCLLIWEVPTQDEAEKLCNEIIKNLKP